MNIPDELLAAYIDGELDAAERDRIERALEADPLLARRVTQQRALRARLRGAFDGTLHEPVPQRLVQAARLVAPQAAAKVIDLASARADRQRRDRTDRGWLYSSRIAIAASLLVGVGVGLLIERLSSSGSLTELRDGTLLAHGALSVALNSQLASNGNAGPVNIGLTFKARDGAYCRTFAIKEGQPMAGLACREQQQWRLLTLLESTEAGSAGQSMRTAGSSLPPALLQAVTERIVGDPLDAKLEAEARNAGWH